MNIHVVLFKHNLSSFANGQYFGNFNKMIELPLDDEQVNKLINFYLAIDDYRAYAIDVLSRADGFGFKFFPSPGEATTGLAIMGVISLSDLTNIVRSGPEYENFLAKRADVWAMMGWTAQEERITVIETTFNPDTLEFSNLPTTYEELETLYNNAESLQSFLANQG